MNISELKGESVAFFASGGLDSCTVTHWMAAHDVKVICFTADLGQPDETEGLDVVAERMKACGAVEAVVVPLRTEMGEAGVQAIQGLTRYEGRYWNTTPLGRYVTIRGVLPHMLERGIKILSHGATGRGNDQARFQLVPNMLTPSISVYAPWRDQSFLDAFGGREEMIDYCEKHNLPIRATRKSPYSTDANLLGLTHEAGVLESLETGANFVSPIMGVRPVDAPDSPELVTIVFERGRPVSIAGEAFSDPADILEKANAIGGRHSVGINLHLVENRFVGVKSRGVYEAPGMELIGSAYEYLLQTILDRRARKIFYFASDFLGEQLYQAYGEDLGSRMARKVVDEVAELATGTVTLELYKGTVNFAGAKDIPHSLYSEENASMSRVGAFDHKDSEGFLQVLGVGARTASHAGQVPGVLETN
ncbi:argininosuccinate synthase [Pseudofrankia inefficax]|uniref:argininosuccinate synthase n=1 Tax=Pseudofrankia inefficax (strain DSM 45817 / CECT 9037 / DDB 130130 / EuI1c) TaxID=298654 RepID=E3JA75_PSEI1|nr:argininosuccinate synthase [Pseudofrankia inefficax]ADP79777.1 argininosuccinate synthase [Pseudofrankia inefficax]